MWTFNSKNKLVEVEFGSSNIPKDCYPTKQDALLAAIQKSTKAHTQAVNTAQFHKVRIETAKKLLRNNNVQPI